MPDSREPPHSDSLERAILACVLDGRDPAAVAVARTHIRHAMVFFGRNHQLIWMAIEDLDDANKDITAVSVAEGLNGLTWAAAIDRLSDLRALLEARSLDGMSRPQIKAMFRRREQDKAREHEDSVLSEVGGFTALSDIAGAFTSMAGFEDNCKRLVDYHRRRMIISACHAAIGRACDSAAPAEVAEWLDGAMSDVRPDGDDDRVTQAGPVAMDIIDSEPEVPDVGSWAIPRLDKQVPLARNRNVVLAARPGVGKTSMAMQIARATARARNYAPGAVAFAGVEVNARDMTHWLLAQSAGVSITEVVERTWEAEKRERAREAARKWGDAIVLNDSNVATIDGIVSWAKAHKRRYGNNFHTLIVDHVHAMSGPEEEYVRISGISQKLMLLRHDLDICVVALAQLNRDSAKGGKPRRPGLADLRGSGSLEQDASSVVFLHQDSTDGRVRHGSILVSKNRYGPCGSAEATYNAGVGGTWCPPSRSSPDPYGISERYNAEPSPDEDLFA